MNDDKGRVSFGCHIPKSRKTMSTAKVYLREWFGIILICILANACQPSQPKTYEGRSQASYTSEPYVGVTRLTFENNKIVKVDFQIVDTLHNEVFGADYEKHYPDNEEYQMQCRNDWQGVLNYPKELMLKQDISKVDVVSGATWSYNIFKASTENALSKK